MKTASRLALCKKVFLFFLILPAFAGMHGRAFAGHASPERVLENKYTVIGIPGSGGNLYKRYPAGLPEIAGILALSAATIFVIFSALHKYKTGKPLDFHFFGLFGSKNGEGRRLMILKRHAKRRPNLN